MAGAEVQDTQGGSIHAHRLRELYKRRLLSTSVLTVPIPTDGSLSPATLIPASFNELEYPAMSHLEETWPEPWPFDYPGRSPGPVMDCGMASLELLSAPTKSPTTLWTTATTTSSITFPFQAVRPTPPISRQGVVRGIGLQVGVRGYQWVNVQAEDILIVRYDIENVSDKDLTKVVFGMYVDPAVGGSG